MPKWLRSLAERRRFRRRTKPSPNFQHPNADPPESPQISSFPDGVKVLHDCPDAVVDICFVHGLTGDWESTWTAHGHSAPWPKTLLPPKLDRSRILTYGYDAYILRKGVAASNRLAHHAKNLLHDLTTDRDLNGASCRPLIFVAHSLGGLVCKKAILLSRNNPDVYLCGVFECTKGIIFVGTPHKGSWMANWAKIPASAVGFVKSTNTSLLGILQTDNELLNSIQDDFWSMIRELREGGRPFEVTCVFEELPLPLVGKVVSNESATLEGYASFSIHADHRGMVRFSSAEDNGFKRLLGVLVRWRSQLEPVAQPQPLPRYFHDCLKSLFFREMDDRAHDIDSAATGTCEWLLEHRIYTKWAARDRGLLWIKGKPGSGKSTLLKHALRNHEAGDGALVLSFFFHGRGGELQKSPLGFFRSLLHQILEKAPDALQDLVSVFESKCKGNGTPGADWRWHEGELRPFLQTSIPKVLRTRPVWLFVDALDECGKDNAVRLVGVFNSLMKNLQSQPVGLRQFHICFSCRHYPILDVGERGFEVCTEHENEGDISAFVDDKLDAFREGALSKIPDLITERARGVFMWARLVVEQMLDLERDGAGPAKMEAALSAIPPDLDQLYQQLVQGMGARSKKLIQWVYFAIRPLNLDELRWAMLIEVDCPYRSLQACKSAEDYVVDRVRMKRQAQMLSRGLVEVTRTRAVQFIHQSVKDFFEKDFLALGGGETLAEAAIQAHLRLSKICLRYLAMEEIAHPANYSPDSFSFMHYATTSWMTHAEKCDVGSAPQDNLLAFFAWPSNALVESWMRANLVICRWADICPPGGSNLAHIASRYGLVGLLTAILRLGYEIDLYIDAKDGNGQTPLSVAAGSGNAVAVHLLLATGQVDANTKDDRGQTPLMWAAAVGDGTIVQLLLESGKIDINVKDYGGYTALWLATKNGHEAIVRLLLDTGKVDTTWENESQALLVMAAWTGVAAIVKLLLDTGKVDVNAQGDEGWTPLSVAAKRGHGVIVRLLLDTGKADVDTKDNNGRTPLSLAAEEGHVDVVQLLLDTREVDITTKDNEGKTPMSLAVIKGNVAAVQLLLDTGEVDVNLKDRLGRTPLSLAAGNGHKALVQLLLNATKVDVNTEDNDGHTPLFLAVDIGNRVVVQLLEAAGGVIS